MPDDPHHALIIIPAELWSRAPLKWFRNRVVASVAVVFFFLTPVVAMFAGVESYIVGSNNGQTLQQVKQDSQTTAQSLSGINQLLAFVAEVQRSGSTASKTFQTIDGKLDAICTAVGAGVQCSMVADPPSAK